MNKLSSSEMFKAVMKQFTSLGNILSYNVLRKYVIPTEYYDFKFKSLATVKHVLARPSIRLAKEGKIQLINFSDPVNLADPAMILPDYFTCVAITDEKKNKTMYVNAMKRSGFVRNTKTKDIEALKLDEVSLYAYLQCGATAYLLATKDEEITNNTKFVSNCAEIYTGLVSRSIDAAYPFGGETSMYIILSFLTAMYFIQVHAGYTVERAIPLAMKLKIIDETVIWNQCRTYANSDLKMTSFADLCSIIEREFKHAKAGAITLRTVQDKFIRTYGSGALFAIEHFQSFLNMVQMADLGVGLYNDKMIRDRVPKILIDGVNQVLLSYSGD